MGVLNLEQAAKFLNMGISTLYAKVNSHKKKERIPAAKLGGKWVFIEEDLLNYLRGLYRPDVNLNIDEIILCQSKNEAKAVSTISNSQLPMDSEYESLLELPIASKPKS